MSPRLPSLTARDLIRIVEAQGFIKIRQKGSHAIYAHIDGRHTVIPIHSGEIIGNGLLRQILKDIGVDPSDIRR